MESFINDFQGKNVLVTGGSRGLGKEIAHWFLKAGARVAICGRKQENLQKAVDNFKGNGYELTAYQVHIAKSDQVKGMFDSIREQMGGIDILINNVGMNLLTPSVSDVEETVWDKIIETNLKGTFLVTREAIPIMKERGRGKIVNISSIAGTRPAKGMGVYCIAKAGIEMLTKVLAFELASDGINVNAVAPAMIRTKFSMPFWSDEKLLKEIEGTIPLGRIAETNDVVGAVVFLASSMADFITGQIITVDGGAMLV